jgi:hypothetical protein
MPRSNTPEADNYLVTTSYVKHTRKRVDNNKKS